MRVSASAHDTAGLMLAPAAGKRCGAGRGRRRTRGALRDREVALLGAPEMPAKIKTRMVMALPKISDTCSCRAVEMPPSCEKRPEEVEREGWWRGRRDARNATTGAERKGGRGAGPARAPA